MKNDQPVIDTNERFIEEQKGKKLFLLDSSVIILCRDVCNATGVHPLAVVDGLDGLYYFVTNDVAIEVQHSENFHNFWHHMLNSGFTSDMPKFNQYPYLDKDGEFRAVQLNALSPADFGQIVMCQKYARLTLVTNDKKQLKSGAAILGKRIIGFPGFVDEVTKIAGDDPEWQQVASFIQTAGENRPLQSRWIVLGLTSEDGSPEN